MKITLEILEGKHISPICVDFFSHHFPEGGSYEDVLAKFAENNYKVYANWFFDAFGVTDDVFEVEGSLDVDSFFYPGSLKVKGSLNVKRYLRVGGYVYVGGGIAGEIEAGGDIKANVENKSI